MSEAAVETDGGGSIDASPQVRAGSAAVLGVAVALCIALARLPTCYESFWLDELHSAWAVWGSLGEVAPRAALGNQTPVYYWCLWFWRQAFGDSEAALRMFSVLLSSAAAGVVAAGVARHGGSLVGGLAAGALLMVDPHAASFAGELRVFSATMLLSAIACWAWMQPADRATRSSIVLFAAVASAAIVQPTSIAVLGWMCLGTKGAGGLVSFVRRKSSQRVKFGSLSLLAIALTALGVVLIWRLAGRVLLEAWQHRRQWATFASAEHPREIWQIWNWGWMVAAPGAAALVAVVAERLRGNAAAASRVRLWLLPVLPALAATVVFWLAAAGDVVAIFHRRYLIAALPLLAWAGGAAVGETVHHLRFLAGRLRGSRDALSAAGWNDPLVIVAGVSFVVLTAVTAARAPQRIRGEDWRAAVPDIERLQGDSPVLLFPGLIEAPRLLAEGDPDKIDYLTFPLSGPYAVSSVIPFDWSEDPKLTAERIVEQHIHVAVLRCSTKSAAAWAERMVVSAGGRIEQRPEVRSYGSVHVVRFEH